MGTDINLHAESKSCGRWMYCEELVELEIRNYEFFAILANVRNPIRSCTPFECITQSRGLPEDLSVELRQDGLLLSGDYPGWATLRELSDFDWKGKTILRSAVVDPAIAHLFGDGKQRFPRDQLTGTYSLANDGLGPRVTWIDSYQDAVGEAFLSDLIATLSQFGQPDDVRIIFSFDS